MNRIVIGQGVVDWVSARTRGAYGVSRGIGLSRNGELIAGIVYADFNGRNVFMHHAIDGRLTRHYLWMAFDYPFNQLKVERVTGMIPSSNLKAIKFAEHVGFVFETVLRDAHPTGDLLYYVGRRNNFRWLNEDTYKNRLAMAA